MIWTVDQIIENTTMKGQKGIVVKNEVMRGKDGNPMEVPHDHVVCEILTESGEFQVHMIHANNLKQTTMVEQMKWSHIAEHPSPKGMRLAMRPRLRDGQRSKKNLKKKSGT